MLIRLSAAIDFRRFGTIRHPRHRLITEAPLLNIALSEGITSFEHKGVLVIADTSLSIPPNVCRIDPAITADLPGLEDTQQVVMS